MKKGLILIILSGGVVGLLALILEFLGNPPNMGFCIACFERDIAGSLGLHRAAVVQYLRPEILGIFFGAMAISLATKEFKPKGGSSPSLRFFVGMLVMIGALVFLGCPLRMIIRLGSGDFNAIFAVVGFAVGILIGIQFIKNGFNLGKTSTVTSAEGYTFPVVMLILLVLAILAPVVNPDAGGPLFSSITGPGSMKVGLVIALGSGLIVGVLAQRSRLCMLGGIRDGILIKDFYLLYGFVAVFVVVFAGKLATGTFNPGFADQPIAHTQSLWNFLGMVMAGLGSVLLGGCPLRQLILAGNGNTDSAITVTGMIVGAGISHNFLLAATPAGVGITGKIVVIVGIMLLLAVGFFNSDSKSFSISGGISKSV